ncbi:hypothetical protein T07_3811, partial [Trichinella nelsoni]
LKLTFRSAQSMLRWEIAYHINIYISFWLLRNLLKLQFINVEIFKSIVNSKIVSTLLSKLIILNIRYL